MNVNTIIMAQRRFSPYELTQLARAGIDPMQFDQSNTTPVEYITGRVTFCDSQFICSPDALIPRIETEELVEHICAHIHEEYADKSFSMLDIGTGTGAIGISVAKKIPAEQITLSLSDISQAALSVAHENRKALLTDQYQVRFIQSNLFQDIPLEKPFDIISANLPYVTTAEMKTLPASVRDHEPHRALDGGVKGTDLYHRFMDTVDLFTHGGTKIFFEIHESQKVVDILQKPHTRTWVAELLYDSFGKVRFLVLSKK